jgi:histidine ammonia-lyase
MSERRIERLVNPVLSELPAFLVREGGLNSGFMIAHCTAASLVSENKVLCHPSSVDSLSTSAGTEDHVSMGGFSARKALQVVANVERVIAIELLAACQAIEFLRPLKTTVPLEEVYRTVRAVVRPWDKDRYMAPDIEAVTNLLKDGKIWNCVKGLALSIAGIGRLCGKRVIYCFKRATVSDIKCPFETFHSRSCTSDSANCHV